MDVKPIDLIPELVRSLYAIVGELEGLFPGRKFTPDGHLVGSIGEVLAARLYDLELLPASAERHDAKAPDGRLVQIKATQTKSVGLRSEPDRQRNSYPPPSVVGHGRRIQPICSIWRQSSRGS
jgi:hypothetical protein